MVNTDPFRVDNQRRPRSHADDLADLAECAAPGDGISILADPEHATLGPAVAAELRRRGHQVLTHIYEQNDVTRVFVGIDRVPA